MGRSPKRKAQAKRNLAQTGYAAESPFLY